MSNEEQIEHYVATGVAKPALTDGTFLELYALCQSLPGSGSAQFATALGAIFGGLGGAIATVSLWHVIGVVVMSLAGVKFKEMAGGASGHDPEAAERVRELTQYTVGLVAAGLSLVLLAANKIVRKAVGGDKLRTIICITTVSTAVLSRGEDASWVYALLLLGGGSASLIQREIRVKKAIGAAQSGYLGIALDENEPQEIWDCRIHPIVGLTLLGVYFIGTAFCVAASPTDLNTRLFTIFWVAGSCTFCGGIVVIPLLLSQVRYRNTETLAQTHRLGG